MPQSRLAKSSNLDGTLGVGGAGRYAAVSESSRHTTSIADNMSMARATIGACVLLLVATLTRELATPGKKGRSRSLQALKSASTSCIRNAQWLISAPSSNKPVQPPSQVMVVMQAKSKECSRRLSVALVSRAVSRASLRMCANAPEQARLSRTAATCCIEG